MKIGALMVTEGRSPIWGIGLASFLTQTHPDCFLHVYTHPIANYVCADSAYVRLTDAAPPAAGIAALLVATNATEPRPVTVVVRTETERGPDAVCKLLDHGVKQLFDAGAEVVAIFDDDDWSPPDRLARTERVFASAMRVAGAADKLPLIASYTGGWMVNLRSLEGLLVPLWPWGSTLAFTRWAWLIGDGFSPGPWPGQDQAFVRRAVRRGATLLSLDTYPVASMYQGLLPINFCHNKNVASFAVGNGLEVLDNLEQRLPPMVWREVQRAQQVMIDHNIWPPGTGDSA